MRKIVVVIILSLMPVLCLAKSTHPHLYADKDYFSATVGKGLLPPGWKRLTVKGVGPERLSVTVK